MDLWTHRVSRSKPFGNDMKVAPFSEILISSFQLRQTAQLHFSSISFSGWCQAMPLHPSLLRKHL